MLLAVHCLHWDPSQAAGIEIGLGMSIVLVGGPGARPSSFEAGQRAGLGVLLLQLLAVLHARRDSLPPHAGDEHGIAAVAGARHAVHHLPHTEALVLPPDHERAPHVVQHSQREVNLAFVLARLVQLPLLKPLDELAVFKVEALRLHAIDGGTALLCKCRRRSIVRNVAESRGVLAERGHEPLVVGVVVGHAALYLPRGVC
mmetsp:Transcript_4022/g.14212  ORF Transcript_4022/g.14212 Transcript_4022/m.14212 type:complete len:201 (-) Transcript_4022:335-937(-)